MPHEGLRELEHLVLLAIARLTTPVHGVPIIKELHATVGRHISRASVYVVLRRLEVRGLIVSSLGDPTPQRGGRAKRLYALTPSAVRALKAARRDFVKLWAGSRVLGALLVGVIIPGAMLGARGPQTPTPPATTTAPTTLSGTWLNLDDRNATDVKAAASLPNALITIVQTGNRIELVRSWSNEPIKEIHVCDGRQNANGYSSVVERTTCRWDPSTRTMLVEGTIGGKDGATTGTMRYSYAIDAATGRLIVERYRAITIPGLTPHEPRSYTQRYRRVTDADRTASANPTAAKGGARNGEGISDRPTPPRGR